MKKISLLFAAMAVASMLMAGTTTWDWTAASYASASNSSVTWTADEVSMVLAKGSSSTNANNYLGGTNAHTRVYKDQTLTFTPATGFSIDQIVITATDGTYGGYFKTDNTTYTNASVSVSGSAVTITPTDGSSNVVLTFGKATRATKVVVTCSAASGLSTPAISGEVDFVGTTTVSVAGPAGATLYYTLDGSDPTSASSVYSAPFELSATTTVKVIAISGDNSSSIATKTFTKHELINCAQANALAKDEMGFLGEVTVTYVNGGYSYIKDASGYALIYMYNFGLEAGDVVSGLVGKGSPYNGLPELVPTVALADLTISKGTAPEPEVVTEAPLAADVNKYVKLVNVTMEAGSFTSSSATTINGTMGSTPVAIRNNFKLTQSFEAKAYDIVCCVAIYNSDVQYYFISAAEHTATALENVTTEKAVKFVKNGQLYIRKNGVLYNALGSIVEE